ncbi:MAG: DNA topoisomerase I [Candidatus Bathyarchaeota archaeon]|jgi:DNA topoisomerase-1|nr:DNA topoisomerase I [Candidatus Bathyarchaeota archaeon A05DMB-5]MDH7557056.1 DNA topoisomerase I [Candidatus Bathyarchaeota archaeon]
MGKYTLIVTEKPDAAQRIALALDAKGKAKKMEEKGVPYYVAKRDKEIVVVPALGHLYTVAEERRGRNYYPVFGFKWVPRYIAERGVKQIRTWLETISKLANEADLFIDACDYDIEGSIIGYCILKYACGDKENVAKRMKYSTLTKEELEESYTKPLPKLDFALIEAGRARHEVDWLYGVNLSRALTIAARDWSGKYATLSTGRVQGPTLKFLAAREKSIRSYVPTPYWEIKAEGEIDGKPFEAEYEKETIETKKEAEAILRACKEKNGTVEKIDVKQFQQSPPLPFDLGALQSEAYGLFGYTPRRTSNIAQRLYLDALISYPRTSSQKLPPAIGYEAILKNLNKLPQYSKLTAELLAKPELKPKEGKKEDPAHPAIYPTGKLPERELDDSERNIWDLVVRRFMAVFDEPAIRQSMRININVNGHHFYLRGRQTLKEGWLRFYGPYVRSEEVLLPPIKEKQTIKIKKVIAEDKFTKPPPRYNPGSLLKKMEEAEIGTKATRADIIQTLYDRRYVRDERIVVTDLGFDVLEVLEKYCPTVVSIKLTKELEERMNKIQLNEEKRENVLVDAVEILKPVVTELKTKEKIIGEQLSNAIKKSRIEERTIGTCPICNTGKLMILYSRKTGKRFIGCTNYFKGLCKTSFPLPQRGTIKPLGRNCRGCGWPTVQVKIKGRRPWTLCFNPQCPLIEERKKRIEMRNM